MHSTSPHPATPTPASPHPASPKTLEYHSIAIPPQLAGQLKQSLGKTGSGIDESAFLQQLHYWLTQPHTAGWMVDGIKWIYNSLKAWLNQFPWMSEYGLRKAIANLKKLGLIHTSQHWISRYQRVMFYRIDYDRLHAFSDNPCDLNASRCANSDRVDVRTVHTPFTETTSNSTFTKQHAVVAPAQKTELSDRTQHPIPACSNRADQTPKQTTLPPAQCDRHPQPNSQINTQPHSQTHSLPNIQPNPQANSQAHPQPSLSPELQHAVAQAIALPANAPLPLALQQAIAQFPERVEGAIAYLAHCQQQRTIHNPGGYLYRAIAQGWCLSRQPQPQKTKAPAGFGAWFDWARAQGWVLASMAIDGVHHTLDAQHGWLETALAMQHYPMGLPVD